MYSECIFLYMPLSNIYKRTLFLILWDVEIKNCWKLYEDFCSKLLDKEFGKNSSPFARLIYSFLISGGSEFFLDILSTSFKTQKWTFPKININQRGYSIQSEDCTLIPEIRELQRSIKTYDMRYFPQDVLLCTSTVHDQSGDICIQGYLRILWIRNTKSLKIDWIYKCYMFHVFNRSISLSCKT